MPDMTMCLRVNCPSRLKCWRYTAHPFRMEQSYFAEPYLPIVDGKCEQFIDNKKGEKE